ncbi:MAG TPA: galactokinase [Candidatus Bathyarchaeia archaeon]|nr:galactokinase [Candidatus Bathyarchaeia archaeon]
MIISKTPLRLTLGGGGTDLPSYSSRYGGFVITSALDKYVYLVVNRRFEEEIRVSYSITEIVKSVDNIKHPVVREALRLLGLKGHLEIVSIADVPAETGLGSSGSFTVSLLHALHALKDENPPRHELAEQSCFLEIEILKEPSGVQDPYIAAFGGFICLDVAKEGRVSVSNLKIKEETVRELENNLLFFYTGVKRSSTMVLQDQRSSMQEEGSKGLDAMHHIKDIGFKVKHALESGDLSEFGRLQHEHWLAKKETSSKISNGPIDRYYEEGLRKGALGGKLMGAGGGGFLMFYCEDRKDRLRKAMAKEGLSEVRFGFEREGSKIVVNL